MRIFVYTLCMFAIACKKQDLNPKDNAKPVTEVLMDYLKMQGNSNYTTKVFIDSLSTLAQWNSISVSDINNSEQSIYIPLGNENRGMVFIFNTRTATVETGYVGEILNTYKNATASPATIIADFYKYKRNTFTGSITSYSFANTFKWQMGYKNGINTYKKNIGRGTSGMSQARVKNAITNGNGAITNASTCTYSYWVTTYDDGSQDWELIGTTCTGNCEMNVILKPQIGEHSVSSYCGGSGGGSQDIIEIIPNNIVDSIHDKCIRATVEKLINSNLQNKVTDILKNIFGVNAKAKLSFEEDPNYDKEAHNTATPDPNLGIINEVIYITPSQLDGASVEFTASVIIHEIIHGLLNVQGMADSLQHPEMLNKYVDSMSIALREFYPQMTIDASRSMSLGGLGYAVENSNAFALVIQKYNFDNNTASGQYWKREYNYYKVSTNGNACTGGSKDPIN